MKKTRWAVLLIFLCLFGCGGSDEPAGTAIEAPVGDVEHLQIVQDNGLVPPGVSRYLVYVYSKEQLSMAALQYLSEMTTTTDNLFCQNDGVTYEMTITEGNDAQTIYVSNNRDCGREGETLFIQVADIEELMSLLVSFTPDCQTPAILGGQPDGATTGYIVYFVPDIDITLALDRMRELYDIDIIHVYDFEPGGFAATMSEETLAKIRCDASVGQVYYNSLLDMMQIPGR